MAVCSTVSPRPRGQSIAFRTLGIVGVAGIVTMLVLAQSFPGFRSASSHGMAGPALGVQKGTTPGPLVPGRRSEGELAGGESRLYTIRLEADQYLKVVIDFAGTGVIVALAGPDGKEIVAVGPGEANGRELLQAVADASGDYRLEVRSPDKKAPACRYAARIEEIRVAAADDKKRVTAALTLAEARRLHRQDTAEASRKALAKFEETLPLFRSLGDLRGEADSLHEAGDIRLLLGDRQKSIEYFEQELSLRRRLGDSRGEAYALFRIGVAHSQLGAQQKALSYYQQALPMLQALGDQDKEAQVLDGLSHVYNYLGETRKSLDYTTQALNLCRSVPGCGGELKLLVDTGGIYNQLDEYQKALDYYYQALTLVREQKNRRLEAYILTNIGVIMYRSLSEPASALKYFQDALALRRAVGDRMNEARTLTDMGGAYDLIGDKQKSIESYDGARSLAVAIGDRRQQAYILGQLGSLYQATGNSGLARQHYQQSLDLASELGDVRTQANALTAMGWLQAAQGENEKALDYYKQALPLWRSSDYRSGEAATLYRMARSLRDLGRLDEARADAEAALGKIDSLRAEFGTEQARALFLGSADERYAFYVDLLMRLHAARPFEGYDGRALEASELARARSLLDLLAESRTDIREGVDTALIERERDLRQRLNALAAAQTSMLNRKHSEEESMEMAKAIVEINGEYEDVEALVRERSPRYASLTQPRPLSATEIQKQILDPETLLLEYRLGPENSYLWAISTGSITSHRLPPRSEVESAARAFYEVLIAYQPVAGETVAAQRDRRSKAEREYGLQATRLSQMLLGPVASQLGTRRLVIASDGALQYLPFVALPAPQGTGSGAQTARGTDSRVPESENRPLITDHEIVTIPSASVLGLLRRDTTGRSPAPKAVAVLADPVFDQTDPRVKPASAGAAARQIARTTPQAGRAETARQLDRAVLDLRASGSRGALSRLPFTRQEAEAITSVAPREQCLKAVDFEANREIATSGELGAYRIVHFATHGLLDDQHPELSGLVLSLVDESGHQVDGFLRLNEVYNMRLNADLVVLSACQTALGKEVRGEGLIGLTRGFMYAGARSVAATLWKVDDVATRELMKRFYGKMFRSGLKPAPALRAAQLEMSQMKQWQAPYYWAGFVLQGEWR